MPHFLHLKRDNYVIGRLSEGKRKITRIRRRDNRTASCAAAFSVYFRLAFVSRSSFPVREPSGAEAGSLGDSCTIFISFPGWSKVVCNNARREGEVTVLRFPYLSKRAGGRPGECKVSVWPSDSVWGPRSASSSWVPASPATAPSFTP